MRPTRLRPVIFDGTAASFARWQCSGLSSVTLQPDGTMRTVPSRVSFGLLCSSPVSNDQVTVAFRQSIGAPDPLRTGSYSKTLTFTLATTAP